MNHYVLTANGRVFWTLLAFIIPAVITVYFSCPKSWVRFRDKCYFFSSSKATWTSSSYVCAELGGTLAHLETKEESDFLEEIVYNEAYIGCLNDGITRLFDGDFYYSKVMTNKMCIQKCRQHYFKFAGTQYFGQCFCGNATWKKFQKHGQSPEGECKLPCYGNKGESCGGHWKLSVYLTGGWKHWVGGTDMLEEGEWIWFPGNTPLTYTDWLSTEPDNQLHSSLEKEHCMSLSPSVYGSYKWSDEICSKHLFFICERNAIKTRHR